MCLSKYCNISQGTFINIYPGCVALSAIFITCCLFKLPYLFCCMQRTFSSDQYSFYAEIKNSLRNCIDSKQPDFFHLEIVCCLACGRMSEYLMEKLKFHWSKVFWENKKFASWALAWNFRIWNYRQANCLFTCLTRLRKLVQTALGFHGGSVGLNSRRNDCTHFVWSFRLW